MTSPAPATPPAKSIGSMAAISLGIGGMIGAGVFTLIGLAAQTAGVLLPLAFVVSGVVAGLSVYSYSKLGATFPSRGGAAHFLVEEFGSGIVPGGINVFEFLAYLIATALYAVGFADYAGALVGDGFPEWAAKLVGAGVVIVFTLVNLLGSRFVGRAESAIVAIELAILAALIVTGLFRADPSRLTSEGAPDGLGVVTAAALLYVCYQGFGVVTNASAAMVNPRRELPRTMFAALGTLMVVYVLVSIVTLAAVPLDDILTDSGHVLADVGEAIAGRLGFVVVAVAALLATASAVNATVFAASNVAVSVAESGQLPGALTRPVVRGAPVALFLSAAAVIVLVLFLPLAAVGQMTSLAFLIVYGAVNAGHIRLRSRTGARAWPLVAAVALNAVLFVALFGQAVRDGSVSTWATLLAALLLSFAFELVFRRRRPHGAGTR